ncbi:MAG: hypothetical protein QM723_02595 [Myxococcaceae bacterium]
MNAILCLLALSVVPADPARDLQHDFDFQLGHWKVKVKKLKNPLHGSKEWVEFTADSSVRPVWGGKAQLEELVADTPSGRLEGVALRLYSTEAKQWSVYWGNQAAGKMDPPSVGSLKDGLYGQDTFEGRTIWVRQQWSNTTTATPRFEQAFSADGGKTWEVNWIAEQTRVDAPAASLTAPAKDANHEFDFEHGHFSMHIKRLKNPLHGSKDWYEFDVDTRTEPVLGGKANLEQMEGEMPGGKHLAGLTLRLYSQQAHQWSLYWANQNNGRLEVPTVGEFKDGRGEFYDQEPYEGRSILVRYVWSATATKSPHFEQSYSQDGGKSWEANWVTDQTRLEPHAKR